MKNRFKIFIFLLALVSILSCLALPALAAEDDGECYEWEYDPVSEVLSNSDKQYKRRTLPIGYHVYNRFSEYRFENNHSGSDRSLYSYARDGEILWENYPDNVVYTTPVGDKYIDDLMSGIYSSYALYRYYETAGLSDSLIAELESAIDSSARIELDVTELSSEMEYQIWGYDATYTVSYVIGAVYEYAGELYYVNYSELENNCFDAEGDLSYREGSVPAVRLDGALAEEYRSARASLADEIEYYNEVEFGFDGFIPYELGAIVRFGVIFAIIGFAIPAVIGGVSLKKAKGSEELSRRLWYITASISGGWLLLSIVSALLLILG